MPIARLKTAPPGPVARWMIQVAFGACSIVGAAWLLGPALRDFLQLSAILAFDRGVATWLHGAASAPVIEALVWVSRAHGTLGILALTAIAVMAFRRFSNRVPLPVVAATVAGGLLLNVAVKHAVQRARPDWGDALQTLETYSFPSGHTAGATLFYGTVVVWLWPRVRSAAGRIALLVGAAAAVLLVATSRIVLGVHFASDCLAAVLEATLWLAICRAGAPRPHAFAAVSAAAREP